MATVRCAVFLAIVLVLQLYSTTANFTIPFLSPLFGQNACKSNICGKGNCVVSSDNSFGFECQCDEGWRQALSEQGESLKFLPCIIPNCTLDFTCSQALAPASDVYQYKANFSVFDPCSWIDCGGGSCKTTSLFTYTCECKEGYYNLFNSSAFPCYGECAIGGGCPNLGLKIFNSSALSPDVVVIVKSQGSSLIPAVGFGWLITMAQLWLC